MEKWYGVGSKQQQNMSNEEIWQGWYPFLAKYRIPGDDLYRACLDDVYVLPRVLFGFTMALG
jgi:hypothetical protein